MADTTDWAAYKALPADERDRLGFAEYKRASRIGTHGPGCHAWGPAHYGCALHELANREAEVEALRETNVALTEHYDGTGEAVAELRKDAARLDWLESEINAHGAIHLHDGQNPHGHGLGLRPGAMSRTLRAAIDAALRAKEESRG